MPKNQVVTQTRHEKLLTAIAEIVRLQTISRKGFARKCGMPEGTIESWYAVKDKLPSSRSMARLLEGAGEHAGLLLDAMGLSVVGHREDGYFQVRADLESVLSSGQSQLIGQAEEVLNRLAEDAKHMTAKGAAKK